ncbi:hypothetical protein [Microbacterium sp.]|uniref:hypothetical protein n=1 Tax=Microbacterium sp. TaxID=51671 RepID=UPI00262BA832|nr:hypothetical protein [Microbacterium sp.]MCV0334086.1 hypothetical protein [Microbacterium sp.]MCV0374386.1 hypothetical protein [Microbacterium sp.]MCV0389458.1 hypothetical protein [Microbacterium sp.]MCV0418992.1 hypothetical protein [Microbacterium sp.]MCV0421298.1 hypothetical protein [Microbacterium sp.]
MSDFRFTGRWLNDRRVMSLTGDDFKAFVTAGAWMVENRTDGRVTADDLDYIPRFNKGSVKKFIDAGLWEQKDNGWLMSDYHATQTSRAEFETLENNRRREREKKARQRSKGTVPGDVPGDMSQGTAQDRQGKAGKDYEGVSFSENEPLVDTQSGEVIDWETASIPDEVPDEWGSPDAPGNVLGGVR